MVLPPVLDPPPPEIVAMMDVKSWLVSILSFVRSAFTCSPNTSGFGVSGRLSMYSITDSTGPCGGMKYVPDSENA